MFGENMGISNSAQRGDLLSNWSPFQMTVIMPAGLTSALTERLLKLIHRLRPLDRQLMLLYLEDIDASSIGEIVGISTNNVRVQIHRIKKILRERFRGGNE
jgi:DNA-directed RNA polymerase specialized sigma24 family protein